MLNNISSPFINFILKDKVDNAGYSNDVGHAIQLDKEVFRGGNIEDSDNSKYSKNWFDDF